MRTPGRLVSVILLLCLLAIPTAAVAQHQKIYDWWRLRNYTPTSTVAALASEATMNDYGRKVFYVTYPILENKSAFRSHCTDSEQSIVLGCYKSNQHIYILDITDERLKGVEEVTAAHEMLHAAYDRLSSKERQAVNSLTEQALAELTDERVKSTIEQYRKKDASIVPNELHSVLGTEVANLPLPLEEYYKKYFTDRQAIVAYSEQYEAEFTRRKTEIGRYDQQLKDLKRRIDTSEADLNGKVQQIEAQRSHLEELLKNNQRDEYNAAVPAFNNQVRTYNSEIVATKNLINQYNEIVKVRNSVASEERDLVQAIDTRITTQPTQP